VPPVELITEGGIKQIAALISELAQFQAKAIAKPEAAHLLSTISVDSCLREAIIEHLNCEMATFLQECTAHLNDRTVIPFASWPIRCLVSLADHDLFKFHDCLAKVVSVLNVISASTGSRTGSILDPVEAQTALEAWRAAPAHIAAFCPEDTLLVLNAFSSLVNCHLTGVIHEAAEALELVVQAQFIKALLISTEAQANYEQQCVNTVNLRFLATSSAFTSGPSGTAARFTFVADIAEGYFKSVEAFAQLESAKEPGDNMVSSFVKFRDVFGRLAAYFPDRGPGNVSAAALFGETTDDTMALLLSYIGLMHEAVNRNVPGLVFSHTRAACVVL